MPAIILALVALNALVFSVFPHGIGAVSAIILFFCLVANSFRAAPYYVLFITPILFFWLTELTSGVAIEFGAYMIETRTAGEATGAFARLTLLYALLFLFGRFAWASHREAFELRLRRAIMTVRNLPGERAALAIVALIIAVFIIFGIFKGFPLLMGADRFSYRSKVGSQALISFLSNRYIIFGAMGVIFAFGQKRSAALSLFVTLMLVSFLYGEKFTSIVLGTMFFALPAVARQYAMSGSLPWRKMMLSSALLCIVLVPVILLNYGLLESPAQAVQRLQDRTALQGQLWFLADRDFGRIFAFDAESIATAVKVLLSTGEQTQFASASQKYGMYYVMREFSDSFIMYWNVYAGGGFVFAHMPYWLMVTGYAGALTVGAATISLSAWVMSRVATAAIHQDLLSAILWLKTMTWVIAGYTMGNLYFFFGIKTLLVVSLALTWDHLSRQHTAILPSGRGHSPVRP